MNAIIRPVTADGMCGYDEFGQFAVSWREDDYTKLIIARDVRTQTCAICLRGWVATSESLRDQHMWSLLGAVVHESCLVRHRSFVERADFAGAMSKARLRFEGFRTIANGYWPASDPWSARPWYEADLLDHAATVVIGSRKNVVHVELRVWDGSVADADRATVVFGAEDVTKDFNSRHALLHAWGSEKVALYLTRFRELLDDGWLTRRVDGAAGER